MGAINLDHKESVKKIIEWAADKKAESIIHLDVKGKTDFTDSIIICNGTAELHIKAIADHILQNAKENNIQPLSVEGMNTASWILIDLADIIVHIFNSETRNYFKIEDLYKIPPKARGKKIEPAHD